MKLCSSCGIVLSESIKVPSRYSTKCKYCYYRAKRLEFKFWYENKATKDTFKYKIECIICGSTKQVQHPNTKTCSIECKKKYRQIKDKVRRTK